jgi:VanZ family protein
MSEQKTKKLNNYFWAYLPSVLWAAVIFFFSNQETLPGFEVSILDFLFKKSAHMFVYAVLYFLIFRAYQKSSPEMFNKNKYLIPILICFLYSMTDEIHQSFVPGRYSTIRDMGYDMLGLSSVLLYQLNLI